MSFAHEVLCKVEGTRPKPFRNATQEGWGQGSCFVNAALQSIFASNQITQILREALHRPKQAINEESPLYVSNHWSLCLETSIETLQKSPVLKTGLSLEHELALTYAMNLLSKEQNSLPHLVLREWYHGEQADANETMAEIIDVAASVKRLCQAKFANMTLQCQVCSQSEPATRSQGDLVFSSPEVCPREKRTEQ